jgi:hypothetical protein
MPSRHTEGGRLAGAVRAEQADDLALVHVEGDVLDDRALAEAFRQAFRAEQRHRGPILTVQRMSFQRNGEMMGQNTATALPSR